ncbi:MAG: glycosyltransferase [Phormidesmis sp.]
MSTQVSVIIPCFNAEKWLTESIDSCFNQTYRDIEIVVVDDGSTDGSLDIIKGYGDRLIWHSHPNQGSNPTRNQGLSMASGDYVLFLDADDYILPERIEKQVGCFERTGADVVFSSVRSQKHYPDGRIVLGDPSDERYYRPGDDVLESLITSRRLAHNLSPMFTRDILEKVGGWDETVKCSQDRDLLLSVALAKAKFEFLPGCYSVYRQYPGPSRVSASKGRVRAEDSLKRTLKAERLLRAQGRYETYRKALAQAFFRSAFLYAPHYFEGEYRQILDDIQALDPHYCSDFPFMAHPHKVFRTLESLFGFRTASIVYRWLKGGAQSVSHWREMRRISDRPLANSQ